MTSRWFRGTKKPLIDEPPHSIQVQQEQPVIRPKQTIGRGRPSKQAPPSSPGLYRFVNKDTREKAYIGESDDLKRRKREHQSQYSPDRYEFEWKSASSTSTSIDRRESEKQWIQKHKPSDNQRAGGAGRRPSREVKASPPVEVSLPEPLTTTTSSSFKSNFSLRRKRRD